MYSLANQILDVYDDVFKEGMQKAAAKQPDMNVRSQEQTGELNDRDYALHIITKTAQKLSKFPIKTYEDVWLSNEYFEQNHHKMPKLAQEVAALHIKKACDRRGVVPGNKVEMLSKSAGDIGSNYFFEQVNGIKPAPQMTKISMSELAEAEKIASNYTFAQHAMPSPDHVKIANDYFEKFNQEMPIELRHGYATAIQKRANELGLPAQTGAISKYASDHYNGQVDAHIRSRMSLLETASPTYKRTLEKMATMKNVLSPAQFAKALHRFDKKASLERYYGGYLVNPYEATFACEPNPPVNFLKTASGKEIDETKLQETADKQYDKIASYFGNEVAKQLKQYPTQIFESLPMDAKEIIAGISNGSL